MTSKPTKFGHVEKFCGGLAFQFPTEEQVNVAFKHYKDPVAFRAVSEPIPDKSDVELTKHKGSRAET